MELDNAERWKSKLGIGVGCAWLLLLLLSLFGNKIAESLIGWWLALVVATCAACGLMFVSLLMGMLGKWAVVVLSACSVLMLGMCEQAQAGRLVRVVLAVALLTLGHVVFRHLCWRSRYSRYRVEYSPRMANGRLDLETYLGISEDERTRAFNQCLRDDRKQHRILDMMWLIFIVPTNLLLFLVAMFMLLLSP